MDLAADFWRGRRVFVTGHTGFKGSWLCAMLLELGAKPFGFSLAPPTTPSLFDLLRLSDRMSSVEGDIRDRQALEAAMTAANPDVVIHMAAQPLVRASYDDPVETYSVNVMGTVHVLEACRRLPDLRAALVVTTDKCYENYGWVWGYRESDRLGGADPYSNSKAACELVVQAYRHSFFSSQDGGRSPAHLATARAGNVIGGGDFALDRLIPDAVRAFQAGETLLIRNRLSIRPWQHVLEPVWGYLVLAQRLACGEQAGGAWNFGPRVDESAPVEQVIDVFTSLWGDGAEWAQDQRQHPHEAATLKLDSAKAMTELNWRPRLSLTEAITQTAAWYRAFHEGADVRDVTQRQLKSYLALVGAA